MSKKPADRRKEIHILEPYSDDDLIVHFAGDVTTTKYFSLNTHTNAGYEICVIPYGKGFFKIGEQTFPVSGGQIFMTKPPEFHSGWASADDPYRILYICFSIASNSAAPFINEQVKICDKLDSIYPPVATDRYQLSDVHHRLIQEIQHRQVYSNIIIKNLIEEFVLLTLRNFEINSNCSKTLYSSSRTELLTSRVMQFINDHAEEKLDLNIISQTLNYSIPHLSRSFKQKTGFSIIEYYNYARLERARKYLAETDLTVSEISEKLFYSSIQHFSSMFKSAYGHSPTTYKKLYRTQVIEQL